MEDAYTDVMAFLRSFSRVDLATLTSENLHSESTMSLRALAHPGPSAPAAGVSRLEPSIPATESSCAGLPTLLRSLMQCGSAISMLSFASVESGVLLQSPVRPESLVLTPGSVWLGSVFSLPVVDFTRLGSFLLLRSFAWVDLAAIALGVERFGSPLFTRQPARSAASMSALGLACLALFVPPADFGHLGFPAPARSPSQPGIFLSAYDTVTVGPTVPLHSPAHLDAGTSATGFARTEPLPFSRSFACAASLSPVVGVSRCDFPPSVVAGACLGSLLSLRSFSQSGLAASVSSHCHPGLSMSLRGLARAGSTAPVCGLACLELQIFALDSGWTGFFLLARSLLRIASAILLVEFACLDFVVFLRSPCCTALPVLISGAACTSFSISPRSLSHLGLAASAFCAQKLGSPLPLRSLSKLSFSSASLGVARPGSVATASDSSHTGLAFPLHSCARVGAFTLMLHFARPDLPLPMRALCHCGLLVLVAGMVCLEPVFSLPVMDLASSGSAPLLHSFARLGSSTTLYRVAQSGLSLMCLGCSTISRIEQ